MSKNSLKMVLIGIAVAIAVVVPAAFSYYYFKSANAELKPRAESVNGAYSKAFPIPSGAKELGESTVEGFFSTTFETELTPEQVQVFYKNTLTEKGWNLALQSKEDIFYVSYFENQAGDTADITASSQSQEVNEASESGGKTIVNVEVNYK